MVFRLCLCLVPLFAGGYANNPTEESPFLDNYNTFMTSLDQFLSSWNETDKGRENQTACLPAMTKRVDELGKQVEKLFNDNENKVNRLSYLEAVLANLMLDCGSPPSHESKGVVLSEVGTIANYRCKKGFLDIHPDQRSTSICQKDGTWTMVDMTCANLSSCWAEPDRRVFYTGTVSTTITGKVCQRWDSQTPHYHGQTKDEQFQIPGFDTSQTVTGSANYCRDPDFTGYVWCYTMDVDSRWEKCDVPKCNM